MSSAIPAVPKLTAPHARVAGTDQLFPVRRVYCVGRNYAEHAREMGHDPTREAPFFFQKPSDALDQSGKFPYPPGSSDVQHEVELIVFIGQGGRNIPVDQALSHVFGYGVGLDMTRRDLQQQAKAAGRPWEVGKAFDHSAPCSMVMPASTVGHPGEGRIWLRRNAAIVQDGDLRQQIWKVPEVIAYLSSLFELVPGDVIMTGTPAGVGPVAVGDVLVAGIENVAELRVDVVEGPPV